MVIRAVLALSCTAFGGCSGPARVPPLPDFAEVTRVVVIRDSRDTLVILTDSTRIGALVRFVNGRNAKWERSWVGIPVPQVNAYFYGSTFQGSFGAGSSSFETQRAGTFASRSAEEPDLLEFARLLGVSRTAFERSASR